MADILPVVDIQTNNRRNWNGLPKVQYNCVIFQYFVWWHKITKYVKINKLLLYYSSLMLLADVVRVLQSVVGSVSYLFLPFHLWPVGMLPKNTQSVFSRKYWCNHNLVVFQRINWKERVFYRNKWYKYCV